VLWLVEGYSRDQAPEDLKGGNAETSYRYSGVIPLSSAPAAVDVWKTIYTAVLYGNFIPLDYGTQ
jgi:hypothetical protein